MVLYGSHKSTLLRIDDQPQALPAFGQDNERRRPICISREQAKVVHRLPSTHLDGGSSAEALGIAQVINCLSLRMRLVMRLPWEVLDIWHVSQEVDAGFVAPESAQKVDSQLRIGPSCGWWRLDSGGVEVREADEEIVVALNTSDEDVAILCHSLGIAPKKLGDCGCQRVSRPRPAT
jgi:hypothetical protein